MSRFDGISNPGSYLAEQRRCWYALDCVIASGEYPANQVHSETQSPGYASTSRGMAIDLSRGDCMSKSSEPRPVKWCPNCESDTERYANGRCAPCRRAQGLAWRNANLEQARATNLRWARENPEKVREKSRRWYEANRESERERHRRFRADNLELARALSRRWHESNPEKAREATRRWREANPDNVREHARRRRARKLDALVHDAPDAMVWEFNPAGPGLCNYCRTELVFENRTGWHVEHVIPLSRGGLHELQNLVVACPPCNHSKGSKLLGEWNRGAA